MSMRVLVIEDDLWLAELESTVLSKAGMHVRTVHTAYDAIEQVDELWVPDVILADVLLAGSTIFPLLHELQSYRDTHMVPVVLCTNIADQFNDVRLEEYGVKRVIDKTTMHPDDIRAAVVAVARDEDAGSEA